MVKCYTCRTGKLDKHGCFVYCNKCSFTAFSITDEYVSSCAVLIGTMVSNTIFKTVESWTNAISSYTATHLPVLAAYVNDHITDDEAKSKFMSAFADEVLMQAINIEVPEEIMPAPLKEVSINTACVGCGSMDFIHDSSEPIKSCMKCGIDHLEQSNKNLIPLFSCNCGSIKYNRVDELIVTCANCNSAYVNNGLQFNKL